MAGRRVDRGLLDRSGRDARYHGAVADSAGMNGVHPHGCQFCRQGFDHAVVMTIAIKV
jgi:hypothetical protein